MYSPGMGERGTGVAAVTLSFRGVLADLDAPEQAVLYDLARRHGHSPLDRGRALSRRLRALEDELAFAPGASRFAAAYDVLAREHGFHWAPAGASALHEVAAGCRLFSDVRPALELAARARLPVVAVTDADAEAVEAVLRPLDGAFAHVVTGRELGAARGARAALDGALRRLGVAPSRVLHVGTAAGQMRAAESLGTRAAWLSRTGAPVSSEHAYAAAALRSLEDLARVAAGHLVAAGG